MGIFWISFKGAVAWPCALTANPHSNIQGNAKCFFIFHLTRANVLFPREGPGPTNPRPSVFFSLVLLSDSGHSVGRSLMRQPEKHLKTRYFFAGGNQSCEGGKFQSRGPQPSQPYIRPRNRRASCSGKIVTTVTTNWEIGKRQNWNTSSRPTT